MKTPTRIPNDPIKLKSHLQPLFLIAIIPNELSPDPIYIPAFYTEFTVDLLSIGK
jgi:hypothetical protein